MPALHCAATSAGPLAMNIGDAMTGNDRFCRTGGSAMDVLDEKLIGPTARL
jgi:hypothetical protein